ncbi:MAG: MBL fold metallo-hydrolase [bacterium]
MDWWAEHEFEGIRFVCTPAQHFSGRTGTNQTTLWASWVVDSPNSKIYFSGVHNLPEEAVQAGIDLRAKQMIPIHWAMFELSLHDWDEPIKRSQQAAEELGMELMTPKLGQVVDLAVKNQFSHWWEQVQ